MRRSLLFVAAMVLAMVCITQATWAAQGPEAVPRMSIDELKAQLANPNYVIIDVRSPYDWNDSSTKIKGAVREDPYKVGSWISKYPKEKTIVFYCK